MSLDTPIVSRRTVLAGTAWAAPAVALATVVPRAAASATSDAEYYWASEEGISLDYTGGNRAELTTHIATRGSVLPATATFVLTIVFDSAVALTQPVGWTLSESLAGTMFTLTQPAVWNPALTLSLEFGVVAELGATVTMSLLNGSGATWTQDPAYGGFGFV